eukprot:12861760-Alexandrium_andersonii.AAC.1
MALGPLVCILRCPSRMCLFPEVRNGALYTAIAVNSCRGFRAVSGALGGLRAPTTVLGALSLQWGSFSYRPSDAGYITSNSVRAVLKSRGSRERGLERG